MNTCLCFSDVFLLHMTACHTDEIYFVAKGGQLLGKLISRETRGWWGVKKKQETRNDPAAKSNNIFIIYFIIHLWMRSERINNRNPSEKMFVLEPYYMRSLVQWHS